MSSVPISSLQQLVEQTHYPELELAQQYTDALNQWIEQHQELYSNVCANKPESAVEHHLLGLLTKSHIELSAVIEQHRSSAEKMQTLIREQMGEHADKFRNTQLESILVVTDFWIYMQGYLKMDYSLAYDHASNTLELIKPFVALEGRTDEEVMSLWMKSFYLGVDASPIQSVSWLDRIKKLFS